MKWLLAKEQLPHSIYFEPVGSMPSKFLGGLCWTYIDEMREYAGKINFQGEIKVFEYQRHSPCFLFMIDDVCVFKPYFTNAYSQDSLMYVVQQVDNVEQWTHFTNMLQGTQS